MSRRGYDSAGVVRQDNLLGATFSLDDAAVFQDIIMAEAPYPAALSLRGSLAMLMSRECVGEIYRHTTTALLSLLGPLLTATSRAPQDFGSLEEAEAGSFEGISGGSVISRSPPQAALAFDLSFVKEGWARVPGTAEGMTGIEGMEALHTATSVELAELAALAETVGDEAPRGTPLAIGGENWQADLVAQEGGGTETPPTVPEWSSIGPQPQVCACPGGHSSACVAAAPSFPPRTLPALPQRPNPNPNPNPLFHGVRSRVPGSGTPRRSGSPRAFSGRRACSRCTRVATPALTWPKALENPPVRP